MPLVVEHHGQRPVVVGLLGRPVGEDLDLADRLGGLPAIRSGLSGTAVRSIVGGLFSSSPGNGARR